jgi:hypothetical protein
MNITEITDADELKRTTEIAVKAAAAMVKAGIDAIGKENVDDYDWNDRALSMATGLLLTSFKQINEAIPRIAAETYLSTLKKKKIH